MSGSAQRPPMHLRPPSQRTRTFVGGPWRGRQLTLPESQEAVNNGWITARYELQPDGTMKWVSLADKGGDFGCSLGPLKEPEVPQVCFQHRRPLESCTECKSR